MKNLFVALGQHHVQNFENLIDNGMVGEGERILLAGSGLIYDSFKWDRVIMAEQSFNNNADSAFNQVAAINSKIRSYKKMIGHISSLKNEPIILYVSYIEDVLTNYLFLSFGKSTKAVVVEDGTLNYYDHSLNNISKLKFLLKQNISQLHGIPFKKYKGHSSGAEYEHVISQFLTLPKHAFINKNAKQLPVDKISLSGFKNSLYIIGQESYGTLLGQSFFENALKQFLEQLKRQPFYKEIETVYYKPHRNGRQLSEAFFETVFSEKKFVFLKSEKTSETLYFEELHSRYVAGFDSSTLINIYSKIEDQKKNKVLFLVNPLKNDELVPLFKSLGFQFLNKDKL
ncbi:polysialyltransferase family glycosyltransferase [Gelidibacter japonicus]|uniref:polysialyltransferase family glycosyltransferase n=1 Tax=Gelidibacter japonicus TaxID=1962232 RepID=UPI003A9229BB